MNIKLLHLKTYHFILLVVFLFVTTKNQAQCAGTNNSTTICGIELIQDSSKAINLFDLLGGNPVPGGTWKDNQLTGGIDLTTGILNAQKIKKSGTYTYTYKSPNSCTNNTATITVTIGGYSGVSSPDISACNDDKSFNLFQGFNGQFLGPQTNGVWFDDENTGALNGSILDASMSGLGTFTFTYTMPAIGGCPAQSSKVNVTVFRAPVPGTGSNLLLCSSDDLSVYSNFDLNTKLSGADAGGIWYELSGTNELSGDTDSFINIQNIYNTRGAGLYQFKYEVTPTNPICDIKFSTVNIIIEEQLDFTGATLVVNSDICESEINTATYNAVLTKGPKTVPDGGYNIGYSISGPSPSIVANVTANFSNGVLSFPINSASFKQVGDYIITITSINSVTSLGACSNIINTSDVLHVYPLPKINTATLTIDPACKGSDAVVLLSGNSNLADGNYDILYNLSGSNSATAKQATLTVLNKEASFLIPANSIPTVGNTTITITKITNKATGCTNTSTLSKVFVVKPLTDLSSLNLTINNVCENAPVAVTVSGLGTLTNITINYNLSGNNIATAQTITLGVGSGNANFTIPASLLPNSGTTTFTITDIIDNGGGCRTVISNGTKNFTINTLPIPVANNQSFCGSERPTVANLLPNGSLFKWYDSATSTTPLASNTPLVTGNYFVKETSTSGCESLKVQALIKVDNVQAPVLNTNGENFCGLSNPTIQNLSDKTDSSATVKWYDTDSRNNELQATDLLVDGATYYGYEFSNESSCYSDALVVKVVLTNCDETEGFFIPDGFSPNEDLVNDTFRIPDIEFIYPNYSLEIYSRFGNLMFTGNKNKPYWDGKSSDSKLAIDGFAPNGVYFYILNYNKGNKKPVQGRLYLNR